MPQGQKKPMNRFENIVSQIFSLKSLGLGGTFDDAIHVTSFPSMLSFLSHP